MLVSVFPLMLTSVIHLLSDSLFFSAPYDIYSEGEDNEIFGVHLVQIGALHVLVISVVSAIGIIIGGVSICFGNFISFLMAFISRWSSTGN